jgi:hypothetical protein
MWRMQCLTGQMQSCCQVGVDLGYVGDTRPHTHCATKSLATPASQVALFICCCTLPPAPTALRGVCQRCLARHGCGHNGKVAGLNIKAWPQPVSLCSEPLRSVAWLLLPQCPS